MFLPLFACNLFLFIAAANDNDKCRAPLFVGPCKAAVPRWHFDYHIDKCVQFDYGGCEPNANNHMTKKDCERECMVEVDEASWKQELCRAPLVIGMCRAAFRRFHFDYTRGKCVEFTYGGCGGNRNNHKTQEECERRCLPVIRTKEELCHVPFEMGRCRAAMPRWYFDQETKKCLQFTYGGCGGNHNNYKTLGNCQDTCAEVPLLTTVSQTTPIPIITTSHTATLITPKRVVNNICHGPPLVGPCRRKLRRWNFDHQLDKCIELQSNCRKLLCFQAVPLLSL